MRNRSVLAVVLAAALLGPTGAGVLAAFDTQPAEAAVVERIVAIVGERAILLSDVRERARPFLLRAYDSVPQGPQRDAAISQIYRAVLGRMVEEELEDRAAEKAGIVVTPQEIDSALDRVASQNNISKGTVLAEAKRSGLTEAQYRDELRRQVLQAKLVNVRLQGRIRVTETDLRSAYHRLVVEERQRLQQRLQKLVLDAGRTPEEQRAAHALATELVRRAREGEDFRELVRKYSLVPLDRSVGVTRAPAQEPEAIRRASLSLGVGEVSPPLATGGQLVIVQVVEREESSLPLYEQARPALHERVYMEKMTTAREHWIESLKRRTHVDVRL
jgi:peptidyl-prolyl cis-trans isomerase SurA